MKKLIFLSLIYLTSIHAEQLQFPVDSTVSYLLVQYATGGDDFSTFESNAKFEFDLTLKGNCPYIVELTLKKIKVKEMTTNQFGSKKKKFDSAKDDLSPFEFLRNLIDHPLYFIVENEFTVRETDDYLNEVFYIDEFREGTQLVGISPDTFKVFLTRLFDLSEQELTPRSFHNASLYLIEKEIEGMKINENSHYHILNSDQDEILGEWTGSAQTLLKDHISRTKIFSTISWNVENALIQQRKSNMIVQDEYKTFFGLISSYKTVNVKQSWKSRLTEY